MSDPARLERSSTQLSGPVVLVILDGVGVGAGDQYDAVASAHTPHLDRLRSEGLTRHIRAHGLAVGLPSDADMGNSEVGHNTMGAGRVLDQGATRIDKAVASGEIWEGQWREIPAHLRATGGRLHLLGLLSDGNVHSHIDHLLALLERAHVEGIQHVRVHVLLDGRDVPDHTAEQYVQALEGVLTHYRQQGREYQIASGGGRMRITMDRYGADWGMVERGWKVHVLGEGPGYRSALEAVAAGRTAQPGVSDQLLSEFVIVDEHGEPVGPILDGDAVVTFNFRGDRIVEICEALLAEEFEHFDRRRRPEVLHAGLVLYDGEANMPPRRLVEPAPVTGTLSELLAAAGVSQYAAAETQKFGHVTYFWNGNRSEPFDETLETYVEIPSEVVAFDERPAMRAAETAAVLAEAVASGRYQFLRCNLAGGDMVGHTGKLAATITAMEAVDRAVGVIRAAVEEAGGTLVVTADHGNAEEMVQLRGGVPQRDAGGQVIPKTSHTLQPVELSIQCFGGREFSWKEPAPERPGLSHLASSLCTLLGFEAPAGFDPSLVEAG